MWQHLGTGIRDIMSRAEGSYSYTSDYLPPAPKDPSDTFANITRQQYDDYIKNFRQYENQLWDMTKSTALIDQARETAPQQLEIMKGAQERNLARYGGGGLTPAQQQQRSQMTQRSGQLGIADTINQSRVQQREVNQALAKDLIGVAQGVNQGALGMLGDASGMASQRRQQYRQDRSSYRQGMMGLGTSLLLGWMMSDRRLKKDIKQVGKERGHNIYTWKWNETAKNLGINGPTKGVMADEVQHIPGVTKKGPGGYLLVNYGAF